MGDVVKIINYLKTNGIKRFFQVLWRYKIELVLEKIVNMFTKNLKLKNIILIESHNDFDCNGGAFYDYLIKNKFNQKYKIVWLVRKRINKRSLPSNVCTVNLLGPSIKKAYYICMAKYGTFDNDYWNKVRTDQVMIYTTHGSMILKNVKGKTIIPDYVDYILVPSKKYAPLLLDQYSIDKDSKKAISIGYPCHDTLFDNNYEEIKKITCKKYNKVILWMPTFRRGIAYKRNDSIKEQKLGIPLFENIKEFQKLNSHLKKNNVLLVLKLHPKQDLSNLKIKTESNIVVLTGDDVKQLNIDNYRLLKCTDALISDYSSISFDYLHLDKPIAYVLDDVNEYKIGFCVDNVNNYLAGEKIYNYTDLVNFIDNVINNIDIYQQKRIKLRREIYEFHDDKSCERLADFLKLNK